MAPSGPYLRGLPRFRLTGSGWLATGIVPPEPETETMLPDPDMLPPCIMEDGDGVLSMWNCIPEREPGPPPPMDWRMAVGLMLMLGMGRMTECIPAREDGLLCPPPPPSMRWWWGGCCG